MPYRKDSSSRVPKGARSAWTLRDLSTGPASPQGTPPIGPVANLQSFITEPGLKRSGGARPAPVVNAPGVVGTADVGGHPSANEREDVVA